MIRAAIFLTLLCGPALADDDTPEKAQARVLLTQGNSLFERGELKGALVDFRAAYALYPSPKLLVNCAAAERELGDLAAAATDLHHYLDESGGGDDDPFLTDRARGDLKLLARKLGRVAFSSWPAHSTIEVDGKAGRDPTYVKPGAHHVKVRAPTGETSERDVDVGAGEASEIGMVAVRGGSSQQQQTGGGTTTVEKKKSKAWVAGLVVGLLAVGGAVALGVTLGMQPAPKALTYDLGPYSFSQFH
jgi:hypothetical protein